MATTAITLVGHTLLAETVRTASHKLFVLVNSLPGEEHPEFHKVVEEVRDHALICSILNYLRHAQLDLEAKLETVQALERDIGTYKVQDTNILEVCLRNVSEAVKWVHDDLNEINHTIEEHNKKWFSTWRAVGYEENLERLQKHKTVLDSRLNMLLKVLMISGNK